MSPVDIVRERLWNQHIEGRPLKRAAEVVRRLVASQAQDFAGAKWALGLRSDGLADAAIEGEYNQGAILRTHVMRPTWHFVAPEDIRWLLALTAPRVEAANAHRYRQLGLDAVTLRKATATLARALEGGRQLTRDELRQVLTRSRIASDGQRMAYMLMRAELDAVICSGARRGKQFTYALLEERAPGARSLSREEALVELAGRYFATRGPAMVPDFAKWSGLTVADARAGLEEVAPKLRREVVGGATYWSGQEGLPARRSRAAAHLLSIYDEYISSYRGRGAICAPAYAKRLVGLGNALAYIVILDGRIAGTWKRSIEKRTVRVRVAPFRKLLATEKEAIAAAATRFARFLGEARELELRIG
jgi:hypothetical protein